MLSHFSHVWLCATPQTAAHQAPLSLGFSRQEHWSRLPFPSPVHESEKWQWSRSVCLTLSDPMDCSLPGSSAHGIFQARVLEWGATAFSAVAAAALLQSCPTLCHPIDSSPPGSPSPGILQARTLEWVAISFSNAWKWKVKVKLLSGVRLLAISWTAAYKAPPSMGFSRPDNQNVISSFLFLSFTGSFKKFEYMFEVAHQKERQWSEAQIQLTSIFYC